MPHLSPITDASSSPNLLGALHGSMPADNLFSMPPAVQPGPTSGTPASGAPAPWQQMPQPPPASALPPAVQSGNAAPPWQSPAQPTTPPPAWQAPSQPANPPPAWQAPAQPANPPPAWQPPTQPGNSPHPWEQGPQVAPRPPWEGGAQPPPPTPQPWQQASNQLNQLGQSLSTGSAGPRVVQGNRTTIALCAIFLGWLGVHKFMLGMKTPGIILLLGTVLTCGAGAMITGIIGIVEGILYFTKTDADFDATYVQGNKEWF